MPDLSADLTADRPAMPHWSFASVKGDVMVSTQFAGKVILLVNTASLCGYTPQFQAMQQLYDAYKDHGLIVLAVPSDDFHQEKADNAAVAEFCEMTYGITLPMTGISTVTGASAHPLYLWLWQTAGFAPEWNFDKVLFDRQGRVAGTWRSEDLPMGGAIELAIQHALQG